MTRLVWDQTAEGRYEAGVDRGVYYPRSGPGQVWNGLTSVQESPSDDEQGRYIDGVRTRTRRRPGNFEGRIEAYTYPPALYDDVLSQKRARTFGFSYRVKTNDTYKIHLVYNVLLGPSELPHDQEDVGSFSWNFTTIPVAVPGGRPAAHLVIDASLAYPETVAAFEDAIYGADVRESHLPSPADVIALFEANARLQIIDHGDGTWTAIGPDDAITMLDPDTFQIDWPSAVYIDEDTYTIKTY